MRCVLVSHTHWDREWYKPFQQFRARLVDTTDRVLELIEQDPGYAFLLDGQSIALEDYLEIRPERREALEAACRSGRIAIGPWYVQPDSLLPAGETHVRNLLEGRRVAETIGPCSRVAYTPDSFGHPAQLPQLFAGFGLGPFVYWRGNGSELAGLPADYRWRAPDGSEITACHLGRGYFPAWGLSDDLDAATARLEKLAGELGERSAHQAVILMNGLDHQLPDPHTGEVVRALEKRTGWEVRRGLLEDYVEWLPEADALPVFEGELVGGYTANLLPGVWSTHVDLKLRNRALESLLTGWVEPFAAFALAFGAPDERPSLRLAWRTVLPNQAHDSICGCSRDLVHAQMHARYDDAEGLGEETVARCLDRLAGLDTDRQAKAPPREKGEPARLEIAVFNPNPFPTSGLVRIPLDGFPAYTRHGLNPFVLANAGLAGFEIDGRPARVIEHDGTERPWLSPTQVCHDVECAVADVPAFGWKRVRLTATGTRSEDACDSGRRIESEARTVEVADDGTLSIVLDGHAYTGIAAIEECGDRGDTYDFDAVPGERPERLAPVETHVRRGRHPIGLEWLDVGRVFEVPAGLTDARAERATERVRMRVDLRVRLEPGTDRIDLEVDLDNTARDHRVRLLFPTGDPSGRALAATTFDTVPRSCEPRPDDDWIHPAPKTFQSQGFAESGGLRVVAPGLCENEIFADGTLAVTLVRSVGWLSRPDLASRPGEAGPSLKTPAAQMIGRVRARIALVAAGDDRATRAFELGLRASPVASRGRLPENVAALALESGPVQLSALKPAEEGHAIVLRLMNPTAETHTARLRLAPELADRITAVDRIELDESPAREPASPRLENAAIELTVPSRALRTLRLTLAGG